MLHMFLVCLHLHAKQWLTLFPHIHVLNPGVKVDVRTVGDSGLLITTWAISEEVRRYLYVNARAFAVVERE